MSRFCQIVIGPAGSGKSTYCSNLMRHCEDVGRRINIVNLDPAAEFFDYTPDVDVRELISLEDVLDDEDESIKFGPNGGLVFCMEFLIENLEWLDSQLGEGDDDYWVFDCPGQIELYTHLDVMKTLITHLQNHHNFRCSAVCMFDVQCITDSAKFIGGSMAALSSMTKLEVPFVNVLSKVDLLDVEQKENLDGYLDLMESHHELLKHLNNENKGDQFMTKYKTLTTALVNLLDSYGLVGFHTLDMSEENSMADLLMLIDSQIQYGEDLDVKDNYPDDEGG